MTIFMHSMEVDVAALAAAKSGLRMPPHMTDFDYLVHSALATALGDQTPKPFRLQPAGRGRMRLLGYSPVDSHQLARTGQACAEPDVHAAMRWDEHRSKAMPSFMEGDEFRFELRACPVVRRRGPGGSKEVDAYLAHVSRHAANKLDPEREPIREHVYREWLRSRGENSGCEFHDVSVASFRIARLFRRTQGADRRGAILQRPDVTFAGRVRVRDPASFEETLSRGIGRHKAFGFGMLLLRPS